MSIWRLTKAARSLCIHLPDSISSLYLLYQVFRSDSGQEITWLKLETGNIVLLCAYQVTLTTAALTASLKFDVIPPLKLLAKTVLYVCAPK